MKIFNRLLTALAMVALLALPSKAYVVDGLLDDWGILPHSNWVPSSLSADWNEENYMGGPRNTVPANNFLGHVFDVEAAYFDDSQNYIHFAIVTNFPETPPAVIGRDGQPYLAGDVGITLGGPVVPGDGYWAYEFGVVATGADKGDVVANPTWSLPAEYFTDYATYGQAGPSTITGGAVIGGAQIAWGDTGVTSYGETSKVLEGSILKSLLGIPAGAASLGQEVTIHWTMTCGNDEAIVTGDIDNPVPEPATMALLGLGLTGVIVRRRKK